LQLISVFGNQGVPVIPNNLVHHLSNRPSFKPYVKPVSIGIGLGLLAAIAFAWLDATNFDNFSFVARLQFQPHLVSEADILRRNAAMLICAQFLVDNGLDFACRGGAFGFFFGFMCRQISRKMELVNGNLLYFCLGPKPYSIEGFFCSSLLEICLMGIMGLVMLPVACMVIATIFRMGAPG
jgi:hypothetical protein